MPTLTIQQAFELALQHHQAGRFAQAEPLYQQILAREPNHPGATHYLGVLAHRRGQLELAIQFIRRAITLNPNVPAAHTNLGLVLMDNGQPHQAIAAYQNALALSPNFADAHCNLGNALKQTGQLDHAITAYQKALAIKPTYAPAHYNLANSLKEKGQLDAAIAHYRTAISLAPHLLQAHTNLGIALAHKGQLDDAIATFRTAIRLHPDDSDSHYNLANALRDQRQFDDAIAAYHQAIAINPNHAGAHNNLGNALKEAGDLDAALAAYRRAVTLSPRFVEAHSNLVYLLHYLPAADATSIAKELHIWNQQHAQPLAAHIRPFPIDRDPSRRLKIGYVSPDLCNHVVGGFLLPVLQNHDCADFEIFAYAHVAAPDAMTKQLRRHTDTWRDISHLSDAQSADLIRQDRIDILVDLALHTANNRLLLFAHKPAPIQVTYLAYAGSSGLTTIDYRLSDPHLDPPDADESIYSEKTLRLPETYWCYEPPVEPPLHPPPSEKNGYITFGCLNNFCKINAPLLTLWAQMLNASPNSHLLLHAHEGSHRQRVLDHLQSEGIAPHRITFVGKNSLAVYFQQYHLIDIALDTSPYGGGTTTCDALWMGVPVVTLTGNTAVGRGGASVLNTLALPELIARSPDQYIHIATDLAQDAPRLADLRSTLRHRMRQSSLMDAQKFARNIESAYRQMWQRRCQTPSPQTDST